MAVLVVVGAALLTAGVTGDPAGGLGGGIAAVLYFLYKRLRRSRRDVDEPSTDGVDATEEATA